MLTVNSWLYHLQMCDVVQHFQRLCWFAISIDEVKIYLFGKESKSSWQKNKQQCQTVLKINLQNTLRSGSLRRVKLHSKQWPNNVTCTCNNILTSNIETVPYTPSLPPSLPLPTAQSCLYPSDLGMYTVVPQSIEPNECRCWEQTERVRLL